MEKGFMDSFESEMTKLEKNRINIPEKERTGSGKYAKHYESLEKKVKHFIGKYALLYVLCGLYIPKCERGVAFCVECMKMIKHDNANQLLDAVKNGSLADVQAILDETHEAVYPKWLTLIKDFPVSERPEPIFLEKELQ